MKHASLFCGIGGFEFGLSKTGWQCVWANDINKYACQVYRKNFGDKELVEGDIRTIEPNSIPDFDLLTAGFPCQSFSLAGKREGFKDIRGTMFHEVVRIAGAKRPKLLLLENVKGLLSNDNGKTFGTILEELGNIGYWVEWQTLNSKYFGVPQNRERVFIVGHLRGTCGKQIFPIGQTCEVPVEPCGTAQGEGSRVRVANSLNCSGSGKERNLIANTISNRYGKDGKENLVQPCLTPDRVDKRQRGRRFKEDGEPSFTLTGRDVHGVMIQRIPLKYLNRNQRNIDGDYAFTVDGANTGGIMAGQRIRRLTPIECERLQGFPDGWTSCVSDSQRYKLLGNAVTTNVISFLGELLG